MQHRYVSVPLDFVLQEGETAQDAAIALSNGSSGQDITVTVDKEVGPTGHPVLRVTGPRFSVIAFMQQNVYPLDVYQRELGDIGDLTQPDTV